MIARQQARIISDGCKIPRPHSVVSGDKSSKTILTEHDYLENGEVIMRAHGMILDPE